MSYDLALMETWYDKMSALKGHVSDFITTTLFVYEDTDILCLGDSLDVLG